MFEYMKCYGYRFEEKKWIESSILPFYVTSDVLYWLDLGCLWNDGDGKLAWWWRNKR